jgi:glutathione S-transferase
MQGQLYGVPGSHPTKAAELMLRHKGIPHTRLDLPALLHKPLLRLLGFSEYTVPALRIEALNVQRTRQIAGVLDQLRPEPPLIPQEPVQRAAVEEAEAWGDSILQPLARRVTYAAVAQDYSCVDSFLAGARLVVPRSVTKLTAPALVPVVRRVIGSRDAAVRNDIRVLAALLDRIDGWIADGVLAREPANVADFQIGASVRLLLCMDDLRPALIRRPAGDFALRLISDYPGHIRPVFPPEWLQPLTR